MPTVLHLVFSAYKFYVTYMTGFEENSEIIFLIFHQKNIVVTPHYNHVGKTVVMMMTPHLKHICYPSLKPSR